MRFVVSVVDNASVKVAEKNYEASIGKWLLVYVGISRDDLEDYESKIAKFVDKISVLKCFHADGKIHASLQDVDGEVLLISNFTLYGRADKWQKLDFSQSADFENAEKIYNLLIQKMSASMPVKTGVFGAYMEVSSVNGGPINLVLDY